MVVAFIKQNVEVADRVVQFGVDDVHQRRDLRKFFRRVLQQRVDPLRIVFAENDDRHHLSGRGSADDQVAHQPFVLADIVERIPVFETEFPHGQPDRVRWIVLQPAFADVEHFVEQVRDVKPQRGAVGDFVARSDLFGGQPPFVRKSEFEFVAVKERFRRTQDRTDCGQFDFPDPAELVGDLLLFESQLFGVGQVLPFASPAGAVVFADRLLAQRRFFYVIYDVSLHEPPPFAAYLYVHHVARNGHRDEYHDVVPPAERLALGGDVDDFEPFDERVVRFFSCHFVLFYFLQR